MRLVQIVKSLPLLLLFGILNPAQASLVLNLDTNFSNATTPAGAGPWLRATFDQQNATTVRLTMDSLLTDTNEFVDGNQGWYFNLNPALDPNSLVFNFVSAANFTGSGSVVINTGVNFTNADGGGRYDIQFDFPAHHRARGSEWAPSWCMTSPWRAAFLNRTSIS